VIVVDASAVVSVVADDTEVGRKRRRRLRRIRLASPDLMRVECLSALRRHEAAGALDTERAQRAMEDLMDLPILTYPTTPLLLRSWQLRSNLTSYDACYVALAEALSCPLLTADERLSRAPGIRCEVEVI